MDNSNPPLYPDLAGAVRQGMPVPSAPLPDDHNDPYASDSSASSRRTNPRPYNEDSYARTTINVEDEDVSSYPRAPGSATARGPRKNFAGGAGSGSSGDDGPLLLDVDFAFDEALAHAKQKGPFRVHVFIAVIVSLLCFCIWFLEQAITNEGIPWWYFVLSGFMASVATHFYLFVQPQRQVFQLHVAWFIIVNVMLFVIWLGTFPEVRAANDADSEDADEEDGKTTRPQVGPNAWFLWVVFGWGLLVIGHHAVLRGLLSEKNTARDIVYGVCKDEYIFFNMSMFVLSLDLRDPFWMYTLFASSVVLYFAYWLKQGAARSYVALHTALYGMVNLMCFVAWLSEGHKHPWFVYVLLSWGILLGGHIWWTKGTSPAEAAAPKPSPVFGKQAPVEPYVVDLQAGDEV